MIGETEVARRVCATLRDTQHRWEVTHLVAPGDEELAEFLVGPVESAAILIRDDVAALRYALALAHLKPELPLVVSIFDRTIADQLKIFLPSATILSPAALAAPSLAGPCLAADLVAVHASGVRRTEVRRIADDSGLAAASFETQEVPPVLRSYRAFRMNPRHHDAGTRLLVLGFLGLQVILVADWCWLYFVSGHPAAEAFLEAARVVATVGPGPTHAGIAYSLFASIAMLLAIVLTAIFTAGLVDRLLEPRLLRLVGSAAVPHKDHVIVVGLGQVGARLCEELRANQIPVVGVERDRKAIGVRFARRLKIPVVIGDASERAVLHKLRVGRCRSLAAVGSNDLDNIAVAVAAAAVAPEARVVLRAGEQQAVAETRSLMPLGAIRDVTELAATVIIARMTGHPAEGVVCDGDSTHLRLPSGAMVPVSVSRKDLCKHTS